MKRVILFIITIVCFGSLITHKASALEPDTHSLINGAAAQGNFNGFSLNTFLIDKLNISEGRNATFYKRGFLGIKNEESVLQWIKDGGIYEDTRPAPYIFARSYNHFHDPTKPLDQAGFSDWLHTSFINIPLHAGVSSIIWALSKDEQFNAPGLGDYSWPAARNYFYNALTATDEDARNDNFSDCFRSIGQLMHLVEDVSVPEHTRNEEHAFGYHYEKWVSKNQNGSVFNNSMANPVIPYSTILSKPQSKSGFQQFSGIPISRLFDTGNYDGSNPAITTGANADIGLAEYTNANFFGRRSAMNPSYHYPREAVLQEYSGLNPAGTRKKLYYRKTGGGVPVEHLAVKCFLDNKFKERNIQPFYDGFIALDENCYKDYAALLLPRAEGYAFSLMQYFFRGQIDAGGATTISDSNNITGLTMNGVKNNTLRIGGNTGDIENMGGGNDDKLRVSYQYSSGGQTTFGNSTTVKFASYTSTYNFTGFKPPIPFDATDKKYILAYRGKLGEESDAVAAKSFKVGDGDIFFSGSHQETFWFNQSAVIVYRVKRTTGEVVWKYYWSILQNCDADSEPLMSDHVLHAVSKDAVYVSWYTWGECPDCDGPNVWYLDKIDKNTGARVWRVREVTSENSYASGDYYEADSMGADSTGIYVMRFEDNGGLVYSPSEHLVKYSSENGSLLWDITLPSNTDKQRARVYADENGVFYAYCIWPDESPATVVSLDKNTGTPIWSVNVSVQLSYSDYGSALSVNRDYIVLNTMNGFTVLGRNNGNVISSGGSFGHVAAQSDGVLIVNADQGEYYTFGGNLVKTVEWKQGITHSGYPRLYSLGLGAVKNSLDYPDDGAHSYATYNDDNGNLVWEIELENLPCDTPDPYWPDHGCTYWGYGGMFIGNVTYDATVDK